MALPSKLKDLNIFNEGESYLGKVKSVTLPPLTRIMEEYRAAGMSGPVKIDNGQEAINLEWTLGGLDLTVLRQYGATRVDAVQLRFAGAYQNPQTGGVDAVEIVIRGRHEELDLGDAEAGEDTEWAVNTAAAYYKLIVNGRTEIEIDFIAGVEIVGGVDRTIEIRRAIGAA